MGALGCLMSTGGQKASSFHSRCACLCVVMRREKGASIKKGSLAVLFVADAVMAEMGHS